VDTVITEGELYQGGIVQPRPFAIKDGKMQPCDPKRTLPSSRHIIMTLRVSSFAGLG